MGIPIKFNNIKNDIDSVENIKNYVKNIKIDNNDFFINSKYELYIFKSEKTK